MKTTRKNGAYEGMGERIRGRRSELALSQRALSGESGVAADVIVKLEHDARRPRPSTVQRLAEALGVSAEYLTTGRERAHERAAVVGGAPSANAASEPAPPYGASGRGWPKASPKVEVSISGEPDEETARMLERWMEEEAAAEAAGEPDPWPEIARSLDEDRTSYRKLFER